MNPKRDMLRFVCCVDLVLRPMVGIDVERNGDQFYYVDFRLVGKMAKSGAVSNKCK